MSQPTQEPGLEASLSRSESDYFFRIVVPGRIPTEVFLRETGEILIGRDPGLKGMEDALHVDHPTVSRRHALIGWNEHRVTIRNFSSKNGTFVNGVQVSESAHLFPNDNIRLGDVEILYRGTRHSDASEHLFLDDAGESARIGQLFQEATGALIVDERTCQIYRELYRLAATPLSVMLYGETGVGKELAAKAVHAWSPRCRGPFKVINCSAVPENLIESVFFGHTKGSFTHATADKKGLFEDATGGTLFLDEVALLSSAAQAKLLRALEEGAITPVGSTTPVAVDVRIIAATNESLRDRVQRGTFREDLYYRLSHSDVFIPPLRARQHDIMPLAQHFLRDTREKCRKPAVSLNPETAAYLQAYSWPGNIRELRAVMQRLAALAEVPAITGPMIAKELRRQRDEHPIAGKLQDEQGSHPASNDDERSLSLYEACLRFEYTAIQKALAHTQQNYSQAAKLLGISRSHIYRRLDCIRQKLPNLT